MLAAPHTLALVSPACINHVLHTYPSGGEQHITLLVTPIVRAYDLLGVEYDRLAFSGRPL